MKPRNSAYLKRLWLSGKIPIFIITQWYILMIPIAPENPGPKSHDQDYRFLTITLSKTDPCEIWGWTGRLQQRAGQTERQKLQDQEWAREQRGGKHRPVSCHQAKGSACRATRAGQMWLKVKNKYFGNFQLTFWYPGQQPAGAWTWRRSTSCSRWILFSSRRTNKWESWTFEPSNFLLHYNPTVCLLRSQWPFKRSKGDNKLQKFKLNFLRSLRFAWSLQNTRVKRKSSRNNIEHRQKKRLKKSTQSKKR